MTPAPPSAISGWITLAVALEPALVPLIKDIAGLFKSHPQLTPEMIASLVTAIHATNADTLAVIAAWEAAHPVGA
jgi:hypothetical protein